MPVNGTSAQVEYLNTHTAITGDNEPLIWLTDNLSFYFSKIIKFFYIYIYLKLNKFSIVNALYLSIKILLIYLMNNAIIILDLKFISNFYS